MLNRRFLRIKVMQGVFAFYSREKANFSRAEDLINDCFAPDLNSMEKPDYKLLNKSKIRAQKLFSESYLTKEISAETDTAIKEAVINGINFYNQERNEDIADIKKLIAQDLDKVIYWVFASFQFFFEINNFLDEKLKKKDVVVKGDFNLLNNSLLKKLNENEEFKAALVKYDVNWDREDSFPWKFYRDKITKDEEFIKYQGLENPTFDDDKAIILHLLKKVIYKDEMFIGNFEDNDPHWVENQDIVKSILVKNMKSFTENDPLELITFPENWEEDEEFYEILFTKSAKRDEEIDSVIENKLKNWDVERLAITDLVIIKMAVIEMLNFPSIPVKVTINEFIELAKKYSTPKSKIFINGVLDAVSKELTEKGILKKSGRGLLDNK